MRVLPWQFDWYKIPSWKQFVLRISKALLCYLLAPIVVEKSGAIMITMVVCNLLSSLYQHFLFVPRVLECHRDEPWSLSISIHLFLTVSGLFNLEIHRKTSWISSCMISPSLFSMFSLSKTPFIQAFTSWTVVFFFFFFFSPISLLFSFPLCLPLPLPLHLSFSFTLFSGEISSILYFNHSIEILIPAIICIFKFPRVVLETALGKKVFSFY